VFQHLARPSFLAERQSTCHYRSMAAIENDTPRAILPAQVRAARSLVGLTREELAHSSGVPLRTVARLELGEGAPQKRTLVAIRAALEAAGVEFIAENGGGPGVRLRKGDRLKVEILGKAVGYAPLLQKGRFQPPAANAGRQTKEKVDGLSFGLRWSYGGIAALLFESIEDAQRWPGFEFTRAEAEDQGKPEDGAP
jgi:transcriptional regulator with XRE-family HTH domain